MSIRIDDEEYPNEHAEGQSFANDNLSKTLLITSLLADAKYPKCFPIGNIGPL